MGGPGRRFTITGTHFEQQKPLRECGVEPPTNAIPEGRQYIHRMSWGLEPGRRGEASATEITNSFRNGSPADATFFLDTSFLRGPLDEELWKAITARDIVLTAPVHDEIQRWLAAPNSDPRRVQTVRNRLARAGTRMRIAPDPDRFQSHAGPYYSLLLLLRKLKGANFGQRLTRTLGRRPTREEFQREFKALGPVMDDRAARFAWKGFEDYGKASYTNDEHLVTSAVIHGLVTGREITLLTRDHDLMDQFYKLIFLLDTHYRAMLFAERYAGAPQNYYPRDASTVVEGRPDFLRDRFEGDQILLIRPDLPEQEMWNDLLPDPGAGWVILSCMWFGDGPDRVQVADMAFCADVEMAEVLRVKHDTGGLNTRLLDGRNCHIWPWPEGFEVLGACVAIARDQMVSCHPSLPDFRKLDVIHALRGREPFDRIRVDGAPGWFPRSRPPTESADLPQHSEQP